MENALLDLRLGLPPQQPSWADQSLLWRTREALATRPGLVRLADVWSLRNQLAEVAKGRANLIQAGDCAEDPAECTPEHVRRKVTLLTSLADDLAERSQRPVLRVGRIAGQFSKPRTSPIERVGNLELPVYRGHMVNGPEPDVHSRRPDPQRMLRCYDSASETMRHLGWLGPQPPVGLSQRVWTSHEALLLDYEIPMLRRDERDELMLASTHWPWIGERTRQPDGEHVALLSQVANPVACKVGPRTSRNDLLELAERLDPDREPGRLTLISRMGADNVTRALPALVAAMREGGFPVIWLCDPMHGNSVTLANGVKTRFIATLVRELELFQDVLAATGGVAGGLHLETTPDEVSECVSLDCPVERIHEDYTSLCDPRLNPRQAAEVVSAWRSPRQRTRPTELGNGAGRP